MADRTGQQIGNYHLTRLLGQGGYAEVYLGEHVDLDIQAAVKVMRTQLASDVIDKFRSEARIVARLEHPNIVRILDFGVDNKEGVPFLVMDYAPNGCLCQRHPRGVPLPLDLIVHYVKQIASALQYAHSQRYSNNRRLIHRDIKPENMLLGRNNEVLLSDFGIAVIAQTTEPESLQEPVGTLVYMAPEQIQGRPRRASDQYALGVVVYEWLCGTCPFQGSRLEIALQHIQVPPPSLRTSVPSLSPEIEQVVFKALAKNPKERFSTVQEFALALEQAFLSSKLTGEEALPRLLYTYRGHAAPVKAVAWSPDGQRIASTSDDGTVQVWDTTTGCNVLTYTGHQGMVASVAWSPNAERIASAGQDSVVQVWDATTSKNIFSYRGHASSVTAVAWSPDGRQIASASQDGTIQVWDMSSKKRYEGHAGPVMAVAWSPDGAHFASGSLDGTVRIWNVVTGNQIRLYHHAEPVNSLMWSPEGHRIASAGDDKKVQVWSVSTGRTLITYDGHANYVNALAYSPNGRYIASASYDRTVQVWSAATGRHKFTYRNHANAVHALAWSPEGAYVASASADHTVQVWRVI